MGNYKWFADMDVDDCLIALKAATTMAQNWKEDALILDTLQVVKASEWKGHYLERIVYDVKVDYKRVLK